MIQMAIVEDERKEANNLIANVNRFAQEKNIELQTVTFYDGASFLSRYRKQFDLVFMDIELPDMNGMEVSARLRKEDPFIILIFVTNLAQYAVKGYEVDALDFIVKPVTYPMIALKLQHALDRIARNEKVHTREVCVTTGNSVYKIKYNDIKYVEISGHKLVYHTLVGNFKAYGTLKKLEEELKDTYFRRCNSCYFVNLKYVSSVVGYTVMVDGETLQISRPKRKEFIRALNEYMCGGA